MADATLEKIVYFVRHGQSEDNTVPVFQSPDSPLSETGWKQAKQIAKRVSQLPFEALIASPYRRTKETAEAISKVTGREPEFSGLFVERTKPASINGKPYADEEANATWRRWEESLYAPHIRVEDSENFDDLIARVDKALVFLENRPEKTFVVVTHGFFLRTIVARVLLGGSLSGETFKRFQQMTVVENTGLTVLRHCAFFEEGPCWRLWIYNDHAHLG